MLTRWNPFGEMSRLEREIYDLFATPSWTSGRWTPSIDVSEDDGKMLIEAEMPGIAPEDVELTVDDGILTLKGKKSLKKDGEKRGWLMTERASGSFMRSFALPSSTEIDGIQASYDKGVLLVEIPKKPPKVPKQIKVNSFG
jgi:HSP20 family protein